MKYYILPVLIFLLGIKAGYSQKIAFPELEGFRKVTSYPVFNPDNLFDFIDGAAENYNMYGFEELNVAEYLKGKNTIKLEIYRHKDNINAFGIYSSERSSSFRFINVGTQGYKTDEVLNFFKGRYYVKLRTNSTSDKITRMLETLALRVADAIPGEAVMPKTLGELPENGRKRNEETYINEGVLGHKFLKGAFRVSYEIADNVFSVYLIDCRNQEECLKTVNAYLALTGQDKEESGSGKYAFNDGYNDNIFLAWKESRIVIIQGLQKDQTDIADRFTSEILR